MAEADNIAMPIGAADPVAVRRSEFRLALAALARDRLALIGVIVMIIVVVLAILAPWVSPYSPTEAHREVGRLAPPLTPGHILGTDGQARDVLTRIIWGGRVSLPTAAVPILLSSALGLVLGLFAGYVGGWPGSAVMRVLDLLFAFPGVLLAIAVAAIMGPGMMNCMLAMTIVVTPYVARLVYTETVRLRHSDFVEAARVGGAETYGILWREILPNIIGPVIVYGTTSLGGMVVFAAGLSFLGVGVQPPVADWGIMAADGRAVLRNAPWVSLIPGLVIVIVSVACNFAGDGLRDALDPRQRRRR
jgi:peptide/nickel transport system permease protein